MLRNEQCAHDMPILQRIEWLRLRYMYAIHPIADSLIRDYVSIKYKKLQSVNFEQYLTFGQKGKFTAPNITNAYQVLDIKDEISMS